MHEGVGQWYQNRSVIEVKYTSARQYAWHSRLDTEIYFTEIFAVNNWKENEINSSANSEKLYLFRRILRKRRQKMNTNHLFCSAVKCIFVLFFVFFNLLRSCWNGGGKWAVVPVSNDANFMSIFQFGILRLIVQKSYLSLSTIHKKYQIWDKTLNDYVYQCYIAC